MDAGMQSWIANQFSQAPLGDRRRSRRLVKVAERFADGGADVSGTMTSVMNSDAESDAAYKLFDCDQCTHANVIGDHSRQVRRTICRPGRYLLIEDTTTLAYPGLKHATGLGPIGEDYTNGLFLHTTLAIRYQDGTSSVLGMLGQQWWARPRERPKRKSNGRGKECNHVRQGRADRESKRWAVTVIAAAGDRASNCKWIYVADRESDIYEVIAACQKATVSFVIRAAYSRALANDEQKYLMEAAAAAPVRGHETIELPREKRQAKLEIRSRRVELRGPPRPGGRPVNQRVNVVHVKEIEVPEGAEGLEWTLLTDLPIDGLAQCLEVVAIYCQRWLIEEFHKALKTGMKVEQSQLSEGRKLSALAGMLSVIATRLLEMKLMARREGEAEIKAEESGVSEALLAVLRHLYPPKGPATWRWLWRSIAKRGGFLGRKGDGDPGWLTLWRGWQRLQPLLEGYVLGQRCGER